MELRLGLCRVAGTAASRAASEATGLTIRRAATVPVVCTPGREEATVRLELAEGWAEAPSDEKLLRALEQARRQRGAPEAPSE